MGAAYEDVLNIPEALSGDKIAVVLEGERNVQLMGTYFMGLGGAIASEVNPHIVNFELTLPSTYLNGAMTLAVAKGNPKLIPVPPGTVQLRHTSRLRILDGLTAEAYYEDGSPSSWTMCLGCFRELPSGALLWVGEASSGVQVYGVPPEDTTNLWESITATPPGSTIVSHLLPQVGATTMAILPPGTTHVYYEIYKHSLPYSTLIGTVIEGSVHFLPQGYQAGYYGGYFENYGFPPVVQQGYTDSIFY